AERGIEECLVGLELLPRIDRAAARCRPRAREKHPRVLPKTCCVAFAPVPPAADLVNAQAEAITFCLAISLLSPCSRASAAIGSPRSSVSPLFSGHLWDGRYP